LDPIAATRAVAGSCASVLNYTARTDSLVLRGETHGNDPLGTAQAIAKHFCLGVEPSQIERSVTALVEIGITPVPRDSSAWWNCLEEPKREIAVGALDGYIHHFAGRGMGKITWARDLFFVGDEPLHPADRPIDITGRIRNLVFGPYVILPPGS